MGPGAGVVLLGVSPELIYFFFGGVLFLRDTPWFWVALKGKPKNSPAV